MTLHFLAPKNKSLWPNKWHICLASWKKHYNDIKVWDDQQIDDFIKKYDPEFFEILDKAHKIFKLDYVRGLILEKIGGAYIDIDIELISPFIHQINDNDIYIIEAFANDEIFQNSLMISSKSSFWTEFLKYCRKNIFDNLNDVIKYPNIKEEIPGTIVRRTVGPIALSNFIIQNNKKIKKLPNNLFNNSKNICFTKHHSTGIWGFIQNNY